MVLTCLGAYTLRANNLGQQIWGLEWYSLASYGLGAYNLVVSAYLPE